MNERIKELLGRPGLERLNDWASIGPVQKAALEEFTELVVLDCARVVTAQRREWQGLTDEEIHDCFQNRSRGSDGLKTRKLIAAAIEAMLKDKNT